MYREHDSHSCSAGLDEYSTSKVRLEWWLMPLPFNMLYSRLRSLHLSCPPSKFSPQLVHSPVKYVLVYLLHAGLRALLLCSSKNWTHGQSPRPQSQTICRWFTTCC
jgi:hypothetical protein